MAAVERADMLLRAIDSILNNQDGRAVPIVVVNGARRHPPVMEHLKARRDIRLISRDEPDLTAALRAGVKAVDTPFFSALDDDDEYLPGGMTERVRPLIDDPSIDVVVTNGYSRCADVETIDYPNFAELIREPFDGLMKGAWLQPCNATYRTATIDNAMFDGMPKQLEWTYLALQIVGHRNIRFINTPTYRMHRNTPLAMTLSRSYVMGMPSAIRACLLLDLPPRIKKALRRKLANSLHVASERARNEGNTVVAWRNHLNSLFVADGFRYLPYTLHLFPYAS